MLRFVTSPVLRLTVARAVMGYVAIAIEDLCDFFLPQRIWCKLWFDMLNLSECSTDSLGNRMGCV
jgi:hypothetical protein